MVTDTYTYPENVGVGADGLAYGSRHPASTGANDYDSEGKGE